MLKIFQNPRDGKAHSALLSAFRQRPAPTPTRPAILRHAPPTGPQGSLCPRPLPLRRFARKGG
jgi:hypothetical protein